MTKTVKNAGIILWRLTVFVGLPMLIIILLWRD